MVETPQLRWLVFSNPEQQFPYRLYIEEYPGNFFCLGVQEKWPGPGKKIFCKLEGHFEEKELPSEEPIEKCNISSKSQYKKKLVIILDRKIRKRCWFLFLKREYKNRPGEFYKQIFWITQASAKAGRAGAYLPSGGKQEPLKIIIDSNERYPYKFGRAEIKIEKLPVGDYGLLKGGKVIAIAERKTMDNLLHEIATYDVLKATIQEMRTFKYRAFVFESSYGDFLKPKKNSFYNPSYIATILADLAFSFPDVQFIFCKNRKLANEWVWRWFLRINKEDN